MGFCALKCACREWYLTIYRKHTDTCIEVQFMHCQCLSPTISSNFDTNSINRNHQTELMCLCCCCWFCGCGKYAEKYQDTKCTTYIIIVHRTSNCMSLSTSIRLYVSNVWHPSKYKFSMHEYDVSLAIIMETKYDFSFAYMYVVDIQLQHEIR